MTLNRPLALRQSKNGFYYVNGTPWIRLYCITGFIERPIDLVVAGINNGANLGEDTLYSGTVAATTEGFLFGYPAIAFSLIEKDWPTLDAAAEISQYALLRKQLDEPRQSPMLLRCEHSCCSQHDPANIGVTRLGRQSPLTGSGAYD